MTFKDLELHPGILRSIEEAGYTIPTPIQSQAIPPILSGSDLLASAKTGTGKTAAFLLPTLHRLESEAPSAIKKGPRILVLVPTRELAMQVAAEAIKYTKYLKRLKTVCIYGGVPYSVQNRELSRPYDLLVATPGRLLDFLTRGRIHLSNIEMLILDEADRMLDMGFIEPVKQIAATTPKSRQTLLFSATLKGSVLELSKQLLKNPLEITAESKEESHDHIEQRIHYVDNLEHKHSLLEHLLIDPAIEQAIVFTATKHLADQVAEKLREIGHAAAALHGDMNQRQRTRTVKLLRSGEIKVLIATDIAARGIDVLTISHVINFDLPMTAEDYVHRIGRTGRAGARGKATSFVANKDIAILKSIERFTRKKIEAHTIPGMEPKGRIRTDNSTPQRSRPHHKKGPFLSDREKRSPSKKSPFRSYGQGPLRSRGSRPLSPKQGS